MVVQHVWQGIVGQSRRGCCYLLLLLAGRYRLPQLGQPSHAQTVDVALSSHFNPDIDHLDAAKHPTQSQTHAQASVLVAYTHTHILFHTTRHSIQQSRAQTCPLRVSIAAMEHTTALHTRSQSREDKLVSAKKKVGNVYILLQKRRLTHRHSE